MTDPYRYFRVEARDLVEQLDAGILELDREPGPDLVGRLLRVAHTLKGAARVVKLPEIAEQTHAVEETLSPYRQGAAPVPHPQIRQLAANMDRLRELVAALSGTPAPAAAQAPPPVEEEHRAAWAVAADVDEVLEAATETATQLAAVRRAAADLDQVRQLASLLAERLTARRSPEDQPRGDGVRPIAESLRTALAGVHRGLGTALERTDRELRHTREVAEQLRLTPARAIFTALDRAVRDVAEDRPTKRVTFTGQGGDVRLGPQVLREVHNALLHVVRNAVVHGIEPQAERVLAGKPAQGRIEVAISRRGNRIRFACRDDGRGFDFAAIRAAARAAGRADPDALGTEELLDTLLRGGLSTTATVTDVSGRGIGLDVVRAAAERLGGEVAIHSEPGMGACVELTVPVSVVSVECLTVDCAGQPVAIPLDAVRRAMRVGADEVVRTARGETVGYDGRAVPFTPLASVLRAAPTSTGGRPWTAVVVAGTGGTVAVGVDRLLGPATVILRPLPDLAPATAAVAGASLDTEGHPRLVLDPDGLVEQVLDAAPAAASTAVDATAPRPPILVVDDSLTTRMLEQSILESAGYEVDVASNGLDALDQAHRRAYGLFLCDVEMPGMDGYTLVERVRADPALRHVPAILVTSRGSAQDRQRGFDAGANEYIVKGEFDQKHLLDRVRTLLG